MQAQKKYNFCMVLDFLLPLKLLMETKYARPENRVVSCGDWWAGGSEQSGIWEGKGLHWGIIGISRSSTWPLASF